MSFTIPNELAIKALRDAIAALENNEHTVTSITVNEYPASKKMTINLSFGPPAAVPSPEGETP